MTDCKSAISFQDHILIAITSREHLIINGLCTSALLCIEKIFICQCEYEEICYKMYTNLNKKCFLGRETLVWDRISR